MDATRIQYIQKELFSRFLPSTYAGQRPSVGEKWNYDDTIELIIVRVQNFVSAVSNIMIIL